MVIYNRNGFSLVELLVVISIIATLTAILLPNFMGAREKATDSQRIQDLNSMRSALRMYYNDNQAYPTPATLGGGSTLGLGFSGYFPSVAGLGYTYGYYQTKTGDGFVLKVGLEARGPNATESQMKCGTNNVSLNVNVCGTVGNTCPEFFTVCAN